MREPATDDLALCRLEPNVHELSSEARLLRFEESRLARDELESTLILIRQPRERDVDLDRLEAGRDAFGDLLPERLGGFDDLRRVELGRDLVQPVANVLGDLVAEYPLDLRLELFELDDLELDRRFRELSDLVENLRLELGSFPSFLLGELRLPLASGRRLRLSGRPRLERSRKLLLDDDVGRDRVARLFQKADLSLRLVGRGSSVLGELGLAVGRRLEDDNRRAERVGELSSAGNYAGERAG